jgi:hypothetical protein
MTWTHLILYGSRLNFLVALHAVVDEACTYWANSVRDLQGKCSNLAPILSGFSSVSTVFCPVYFLSKKDPVKWTLFNNSKISEEVGTWTPGYGKAFFHMIYFSHKYHTEEPTVQMYISSYQFSTINENTNQVLNDLGKTETKTTDMYWWVISTCSDSCTR